MKDKTGGALQRQPQSGEGEGQVSRAEVDDLSAQQQTALAALLSSPTLRQAGEKAGVSETTLWRYMQDETFSRRLREARREVVSHAVLRLQSAAADAVKTLHDIVLDAEAGAAPRIAAARIIIEQTFRALELDDLRARLAELEQFILRRQEEEARDRGRRAAGGQTEEEDEDEDED